MRSRLYLETIKDGAGEEIAQDIRLLRVMKANYGPAGQELRLRWRNGLFVLDGSGGGVDRLIADAKAERVFLDLLAAFAAQGRHVSPKISNTYAPAVFEKHPNAEGVTRKAFASAMERLLTARRIRVDTIGPPSRLCSKLSISEPREDQ